MEFVFGSMPEEIDRVARNRPLTRVDWVGLETHRRMGIVPRRFQVDFGLAVDEGQDVICVAGTGSGKSVAFIMVHILCEDAITWIVSPLNVIENQMAKVYSDAGFPAVAVNALTCTPELIAEIKAGKYKVIISSPESYKDANKLRLAVASPELAHKKHVTIVDEAHCISTWGASGFRKDFERIGDMRVFMPNPKNSPMCAATATLTPKLRQGVIRSLHIDPDHYSINIGNWRRNLRYGLHVMQGGQQSYSEIRHFFTPRAPNFMDTPQALIFVESYDAAHAIAHELREHYGLSGEEASDLIPIYHSLIDDASKQRMERRFKQGKCRVMICTEALTMGADFSGVVLVIGFLPPSLLETWLQRAGRGARAALLICLCILVVTKHMVQKAARICKEAGIEVDPVLLAMKVEEDSEEQEVVEETSAPEESETVGQKKRGMSIEMARYIATGYSGGCLTQVIDDVFQNPAHDSCYEVKGCENCLKRRMEAEPDRYREQRQETSERQPERVEDTEDDELKHRVPVAQATMRIGAERKRFAEGLMAWREQKLLETLEEYDIDLDSIMTKKELDRIAKYQGVVSPSDFDKPEINEDERIAVAQEQARVKAEETQHTQEERKIQAKEDAQEKQAKSQVQGMQSLARKVLQSASSAPLHPVDHAESFSTPTGSSVALPSGSSINVFSIQTPDQPMRARPVGRMMVSVANGLPSPVTPTTGLAPPIPWPTQTQSIASSSQTPAHCNNNSIPFTPDTTPSSSTVPLPVPEAPTPCRPSGTNSFTWVVEDPTAKPAPKKRGRPKKQE